MSQPSDSLTAQLQLLSRALQDLHARILDVERQFDPALAGVAGLGRLANDPAWAWLRSLSSLIADVDHVLASRAPLTEQEAAVVAAQVRGLLFGQGDRIDAAFLERYRPLLQMNASLASVHGQIKRSVDGLPAEPDNESERLHARHVWAMRCKHPSRRA